MRLKRDRWVAVAMIAVLVSAGACSGDGTDSADRGDASDRSGGIETPTFSDGEDGTIPASPESDEPGQTTAISTPGGTIVASKEAVSFKDTLGDATPGVGTQSPPPWTDLAGGALEGDGNAYRLTILLGGAAPESAPGPETMNIATFFDIDGDGAVERELWVNLGPNGWGPVWYDDKGNAARGGDANTKVVVEGNEVRLLFPDIMLEKPERLRFSIASEYGPLTSIGTSTARRDDAPDDDRAVTFP